jgi:hypothetical protein
MLYHLPEECQSLLFLLMHVQVGYFASWHAHAAHGVHKLPDVIQVSAYIIGGVRNLKNK